MGIALSTMGYRGRYSVCALILEVLLFAGRPEPSFEEDPKKCSILMPISSTNSGVLWASGNHVRSLRRTISVRGATLVSLVFCFKGLGFRL